MCVTVGFLLDSGKHDALFCMTLRVVTVIQAGVNGVAIRATPFF